MFYLIAAVLVLISLFLLYNSVSAFNELRKGIKKKVQARPYMVVLFLFLSLIFAILAYFAIIYQTTWDEQWNDFWLNSPNMISEKSKLKIYNAANNIEDIMLYFTIGVSLMFALSIQFFRRLSPHLFVGSIGLAILTFICFIVIQYTEPGGLSSLHEQQSVLNSKDKDSDFNDDDSPFVPSYNSGPHANSDLLNEYNIDAVAQYLQDKDTDVLKLSAFVKDYFGIPRNIEDSNIDQLRQYARGLTEIKQGLVKVNIPRGAEGAAKLTSDWLQQEINLISDCLASKRETGILGLIVRLNNAAINLISDREKEHADLKDKLRTLRGQVVSDLPTEESQNEEEILKSHFSFIK